MMGAVWTQIKLTNLIDEALINRGLLAPHLLRESETQALVDTGSTYLVISPEVVQKLGLRIVGQQVARYADGREDRVDVTEPIIVELEGRKTAEDALVTGEHVLIGQVVLEKLDLLVDCKNQKLIPNPEHPDYLITYIL